MADQKWEGKCTRAVKGVPADQVWALLADFCNVQKCVPNISKCIKVEGEDYKPGLVRLIHYCVSSNEPRVLYADIMEKKNNVVYVKERLVTIDDKERLLRYELVDNNLGLKTYEAAFKVEEISEGCNILWSYAADPIDGMAKEDMEAQRIFTLETIVQKIQSDFSA